MGKQLENSGPTNGAAERLPAGGVDDTQTQDFWDPLLKLMPALCFPSPTHKTYITVLTYLAGNL